VAGYASRDWVLALSSLLLLLLPPAPEGIGLGFCTHEVFFKKTLLLSVMSRCYPYPPPGYEKEAHKLTDLAPPITKKERHKHKDKKKKKKKEKEKEKAGDLNGEAHGKFARDLVSLGFLLLPPSLPPFIRKILQ